MIHPQPAQTVLAVDDTPSNLRILTSVLSPAFKVRVSTSGAEALAHDLKILLAEKPAG